MKRFIWSGSAGFILCTLPGIALGSGSYTVYYGEGLSYLSNDPRACANCHIMRDHFEAKRRREMVYETLELHRNAEWRLDYVAAENSMGFHASQPHTITCNSSPSILRPIRQRNGPYGGIQ